MSRNTNATADIGSEPYHTSMHIKQSRLAARRASWRVSRHHRVGRQAPERVLSLTPLQNVSIVLKLTIPSTDHYALWKVGLSDYDGTELLQHAD